MHTPDTKKQKGFVILFAILVAAIVLAIAIGISNVAYKEILLSASARESHYSFFSADTGAECALYYDLKLDLFAADANTAGPVNNINCDGLAGYDVFPSVGSNNEVVYDFLNPNLTNNSSFEIDSTPPGGVTTKLCNHSIVTKHVPVPDPNDPANTLLETRIDSYGYNIPCSDLSTAVNRRLVERHVYVHYYENLP
jgi:hypothetical protein